MAVSRIAGLTQFERYGHFCDFSPSVSRYTSIDSKFASTLAFESMSNS
jgi:hypothetical protein